MRVNRDLITNVSATLGPRAAYDVVDALQNHPPQHQLAAVAAVFVLVSDLYGMDIPDMVQVFRNMTKDERNEHNEHIRALKLYIQHELTAARAPRT